MTARAAWVLAVVLVVLVVGTAWTAVAGLPLLSESWTQLDLVRAFDGPMAAFDPALVPFRPLQHLSFWLFDRAGAQPALGRAVTFGLHGLSALLVFSIVLRLGATRRAAWIAVLLFLAFPSAKALTWLAAISSPARTCCLLWFVWATVVFAERRSQAIPAGMVAVLVVALGFHQSCVIAPAILGLGLVALGRGTLAERSVVALAALRRPAVLAVVVLAIGYTIYVGTLQQRSYHGIAQPGAIVANVARAALAFAPEWVRLPALDGLRAGGVGLVVGGAAVGSILLGLLLALWRGDAIARWLLGVVVLDLVLPVATTGFVSRYAYFGSALLAIAIARAADRAFERAAGRGPGRTVGRAGDPMTAPAARWSGRGLLPVLAIASLGTAWAIDHVVDVRELRQAGALLDRLRDDAAAARATAPPGQRIALVDAPDHVGGDDDIPVANWGLASALAARGVQGPWLLLRVDRCWTTSDHRAVDETELARIAADPDLLTLRYDPATGGFARWRPR